MNKTEITEAFQPLSNFETATVAAKDVEIGERRTKIGALTFQTNPIVLGSINDALPVPSDYFSKLPTGLVVPHTRHWLAEAGDEHLTAIVAPNADRPLAITLGDVAPTRPTDVIDALAETVEIGEWVAYERTPVAWRLLAVTEIGRAIRVGDVTKAGIEIAGSLTGQRALTATLVTYRLVCTNGAVHAGRGQTFRRNLGSGDGLGDWLSDAAAGVLGGADHAFDDLARAAETPVTDEAVASLDVTLRALRFAQRSAVMRRIREEPPTTVYDLLQHISYVATHHDAGRSAWGSFRRRRRMQIIAGALAGSLSTCDSCHQIVAAGVHVDEDGGDERPSDSNGAGAPGRSNVGTPRRRRSETEAVVLEPDSIVVAGADAPIDETFGQPCGAEIDGHDAHPCDLPSGHPGIHGCASPDCPALLLEEIGAGRRALGEVVAAGPDVVAVELLDVPDGQVGHDPNVEADFREPEPSGLQAAVDAVVKTLELPKTKRAAKSAAKTTKKEKTFRKLGNGLFHCSACMDAFEPVAPDGEPPLTRAGMKETRTRAGSPRLSGFAKMRAAGRICPNGHMPD